jgi:hypothetical protein
MPGTALTPLMPMAAARLVARQGWCASSMSAGDRRWQRVPASNDLHRHPTPRPGQLSLPYRAPIEAAAQHSGYPIHPKKLRSPCHTP